MCACVCDVEAVFFVFCRAGKGGEREENVTKIYRKCRQNLSQKGSPGHLFGGPGVPWGCLWGVVGTPWGGVLKKGVAMRVLVAHGRALWVPWGAFGRPLRSILASRGRLFNHLFPLYGFWMDWDRFFDLFENDEIVK